MDLADSSGCDSIPMVIPYVGTLSGFNVPKFERYHISHSSNGVSPPLSDANAQVNIAVNFSGGAFYDSEQPYN